jgi:hypothetical protein
MAFDKEAQRVRALQHSANLLAAGIPAPMIPPPPKSAPTLSKAWPFTLPTAAHLQPTVTPVAPLIKKKEPKMAVNYSAEPFTNSLGQTIQPGQKVICVSQGYNHTTKVGFGEYLGLRRDSRGNVRNVVVMRTIEKYGYQLNGKTATYKTAGASYAKYITTGKTSLPSKRIYPTV